MKALVKSAIQFVSIFLLVILACPTVNAEPMDPPLSKESVNKLIIQINRSKRDKILVNNFLNIALYYLSESDKESEKYINSAISLSKQLSYEDGLIKGMCLQATYLQTIVNDPRSASKVIEKVIVLSREKNNTEMQAYAYYTMGSWFSISDLQVAEEYYVKARNLYKISGNKIKEAFLVKCIANTHLFQNKLSQSLKDLFETLEIYKSAGEPNLHYTYDLIGVVYKSMGNYQEALKYSLLTIKSAQKTKDTTEIALFYLRVGTVFKELNQPDDAIEYFLKVQKKAQNDGGRFNLLRPSASNISSILIQTGKSEEALQFYKKAISVNPVEPGSLKYCIDQRALGDIYFSLKQYDKAEKHYMQMLKLNEKNSFADYFNLMSFLKTGNFYIAQGKFAKAREYIDKAMVQKSLKSKTNIANLNLQQFKIDSAAMNYLSAIKHYQIYRALNDSMFNEKKSNQIASINIQYETEKKKQKIGILTAENREQKVILEQRIFERNVFTAGAIMLLLLLLLSVNRYRIKQKSNLQLQEQQEIINKKNKILNSLLKEKEELLYSKDKLITEKEWLIKEVHHRVKNNLQMISTLLYSQAIYLKDEAAIDAINESQQRIHAISLMHQKLYQSDNLQLVNMESYVHELVDYLKEGFDNANEIEFNLEVGSFEMDILKAIPLGLILNEAITNSLKYAFDKNERKIISIYLQHEKDQSILLVIKDNGKGIPVDFNPVQSDSLGINLMHGLSNQINAEFSIKNENGTRVSLEFKEVDEQFLD